MHSYQELSKILDQSKETLTEENLQLLVENRIDFIKNSVKDKIQTEHDPESSNLSSDKIVDKIAKSIDPTTRKSHTQWLVNRYKAGDFKLSDAKHVKKTMSSYEEASPYLENKDLNSYKSLTELKNHIAPTTKKRQLAQSKSPANKEEGEDTIYENNGITGHKLLDKETSIKNYGPNGKIANCTWCTASNGNENMFDSYKGGMYPMRFPNGRVLQIHHQSSQIKNEKNQQADLNDPGYKPYKEQIYHFIKQTADLENLGENSELVKHHVPRPTEKLDAAFEKHENNYQEHLKEPNNYSRIRNMSDSADNIADLAKNTKLTDEQIEKLKSVKTPDRWRDNIKNVDYSEKTSENKHLEPHQITNLMDHATNAADKSVHSNDIVGNLVKNENISDEDLHKAVGHALNPNNYTEGLVNVVKQHIMFNSPNAKAEHFDRFNPNEVTKEMIVESSHSKHIPEQYFHDVKHLGNKLANNSKTPESILREYAQNDENHEKLLEHPHLPKDILLGITSKKRDTPLKNVDIHKIVSREDLEPSERSSVIHSWLNNNIKADTSYPFAASNRLSREDLNSIINSNKLSEVLGSHRTSILSNPKLRHKEIENIIDKPEFSSQYAARVMSNPTIRPSTVDKLQEKFPNDSIVNEQVIKGESSAIEPRHVTNVLKSNASRLDKMKALQHQANSYEHFSMFENDPRFHAAISSSVNAPASILHKLSSSPFKHVRQNVAENKNTEDKTLNILKTDADKDIASIAAKRVK